MFTERLSSLVIKCKCNKFDENFDASRMVKVAK